MELVPTAVVGPDGHQLGLGVKKVVKRHKRSAAKEKQSTPANQSTSVVATLDEIKKLREEVLKEAIEEGLDYLSRGE
uniref:Uncharacterized protein n=1 Tax=Oryza glumipatula TaxID=40148 RepID=A0A0E0BQR6_9ORYZ